MSLNSEIRVTCPSCRQATATIVWSSINTSVDPHLRDLLIDHQLNVLTCSCGTITEIATELLYHDMDRQYQVWLRPRDEDGTITLDSLSLGFARSVLSGYRLRIVRTRNELTEKIRIFDSAYDDRVIELLKYVLWGELVGSREPPPDRLFFLDSTAADREQSETRLTFVLLSDSAEPTPYEVPVSLYDKTAAFMLNGHNGDELLDDTKWRIVGSEFGKALWAPTPRRRF